MINQYMQKIDKLLKQVTKDKTERRTQVAEKIARALQKDGVSHLFGSGLSDILAEELYYRAGGLVPVNPILHEPLMLHEGAIKSSELERQENYAQEFMADQDIRPED